MAARCSWWRGLALAAGLALVLAAPAALFWKAIRPEPWNSRTVKIRYRNVRYEGGGLVFRYSVQNLTRHTARFLPDAARIRALQPADRPPVGYANIRLPLELPAASVSDVELRLELPANPLSMWRELSDEQTRLVLRHKPSGGSPDTDSPGSPLPMLGPLAPHDDPSAGSANFSLDDFLTDLQGFELTDPNRGVKLIFPRGW